MALEDPNVFHSKNSLRTTVKLVCTSVAGWFAHQILASFIFLPHIAKLAFCWTHPNKRGRGEVAVGLQWNVENMENPGHAYDAAICFWGSLRGPHKFSVVFKLPTTWVQNSLKLHFKTVVGWKLTACKSTKKLFPFLVYLLLDLQATSIQFDFTSARISDFVTYHTDTSSSNTTFIL